MTNQAQIGETPGNQGNIGTNPYQSEFTNNHKILSMVFAPVALGVGAGINITGLGEVTSGDAYPNNTDSNYNASGGLLDVTYKIKPNPQGVKKADINDDISKIPDKGKEYIPPEEPRKEEEEEGEGKPPTEEGGPKEEGEKKMEEKTMAEYVEGMNVSYREVGELDNALEGLKAQAIGVRCAIHGDKGIFDNNKVGSRERTKGVYEGLDTTKELFEDVDLFKIREAYREISDEVTRGLGLEGEVDLVNIKAGAEYGEKTYEQMNRLIDNLFEKASKLEGEVADKINESERMVKYFKDITSVLEDRRTAYEAQRKEKPKLIDRFVRNERIKEKESKEVEAVFDEFYSDKLTEKDKQLILSGGASTISGNVLTDYRGLHSHIGELREYLTKTKGELEKEYTEAIGVGK